LINYGLGKTKDDIVKYNAQTKKLLMLFLESELNRMSVWSNPLNTPGHGNSGSFVNNVEKSMLVDVSSDQSVLISLQYVIDNHTY
jgi:phosphatidylinositol 4-kinase